MSSFPGISRRGFLGYGAGAAAAAIGAPMLDLLLGREALAAAKPGSGIGYFARFGVTDKLIRETLSAALARGGDFGPEVAELKRRWSFEANGVRLHEYYFEALKSGQPGLGEGSDLTKDLKRQFGGFASWRKEFAAVGKLRGIGWAVLSCDPRTGDLVNVWITSHEDGHPVGFAPLLVLDVWEHAYMVDWAAGGRAEYVDAFFKNVDWARVERRHHDALGVALARHG